MLREWLDRLLGRGKPTMSDSDIESSTTAPVGSTTTVDDADADVSDTGPAADSSAGSDAAGGADSSGGGDSTST